MTKMAGLIARFFQMDPLAVIDGGYDRYAFRAAAYRYVLHVEETATEKARAEAKAKSGR